jgi:nitroreductase
MAIKKNSKLLEGIQSRVSHAILTEPAPTEAQLAECYQAAFRAPDHAYLRPWRFIEVRDEQRETLGQEMARALMEEDPCASEAAIGKALKSPLRAPLVIIAYARIHESPKVPDWEQVVATGCAVQNLITAAYAQGIGAVWRTGPLASSKYLAKSLGLLNTDKIVGFLYLGTPVNSDKVIQELKIDDFVSELKLN